MQNDQNYSGTDVISDNIRIAKELKLSFENVTESLGIEENILLVNNGNYSLDHLKKAI